MPDPEIEELYGKARAITNEDFGTLASALNWDEIPQSPYAKHVLEGITRRYSIKEIEDYVDSDRDYNPGLLLNHALLHIKDLQKVVDALDNAIIISLNNTLNSFEDPKDAIQALINTEVKIATDPALVGEHIDTKRLDHLMTVLWRSFPEVGLNTREDIDKDMEHEQPPFTIGSMKNNP